MADLQPPQDKAQLLAEIRQAHIRLEELLARLGREQMTQPGVYGQLSIKDVLAHLTAWELLMLDWLSAGWRGETPVVFAPGYTPSAGNADLDQVIDRLNERIYVENRDQPLDEVLARFRAAHAQTVDVLEQASDSDLFDPNGFPWRNGRPFWIAVMGNTYDHYREHTELIQAWLDQR
jgi:hypothetical protein